MSELSLRERKKAQTRLLIADMAMGLFAERGFDAVTVAEVARAADVSVNTVFNYFPTKEDLFFDRQAEVEDLLSAIVREREPGESAVGALRRVMVDGMTSDDWRTGLWDGAAEFFRLVDAAPSLRSRERELGERSLLALARTLADETDASPDDPLPIVVAGLVIGAREAVVGEARRRLSGGEPLADVKEWAVAAYRRAFELIERGVPADYGVRP
ncbi:TetR/AcrR family transcriptional regulator [Cryptosporangium aurantiacum]|uniref:Transcriptional regulator, TetR family n=1 Tax=Cryptosporangium aurantiacum TaxID=134849 RepID=A0A1M7QRJ8_9ACTN|nr:TetR family transcriptional regulator [Cryptosporangium aurantiacum]SHN34268.1 transcriptional regulator, TetR family [Cryptosporangium aurantiacum]